MTDQVSTRAGSTPGDHIGEATKKVERQLELLDISSRTAWFWVEGVREIVAQRDAALAALRPFAEAGRIIEHAFGPALFPDEAMAFQCEWSENGKHGRITWGDFRRARKALMEYAVPKVEAHDG